ncbi:MAG: diguanylate cyclase [Proteobacteria bacterium]|nr:diguanylate cyclase [Pseudomonadota bacterium]
MSRTDQPLTILVVDDDTAVRAQLAGMLDGFGHRVIEAHNAERALEQLRRHPPDLVLLDVVMPGLDGYWLASEIRASESGGRWTPIVFLSGRDHDEDLVRGIEAGGDDYLVKPVSAQVLAAKLRAMHRLLAMQERLLDLSAQLRLSNQQLRHLSEHDTLTGLLNRRGFDERFNAAIALARRNRTPLTLILCDIDYFKPYNDSVGHAAGDRCLGEVGRLMAQMCRRPGDEVARYGGEEFALILPETPKSGAMTLARAMQRVFEAAGLPHPASPIAPHVTISGGITTCVPDDATTMEGMLTRADGALYVAKSKGRKRFFSFEMQLDTVEQLAGVAGAA